jgi:formamidopyrimidine-DNA glycosylase
MTGQLTVTSSKAPRESHTHLIFELNRRGGQLRFRDIRRFGSATLFLDRASLEQFFIKAGLGPEPFDVSVDDFRTRLAGTRRNLKAVLLDQSIVAGVGNIYADESLFEAGLHPSRAGNSLSPTEADRLRVVIAQVLRRAIDKRGSTIRDYVGGSGLSGEFQHEFQVYARTGEPCPRCATPIEVQRLAGRSSHFCPRCQPRLRGRQ